jgi:hypothetical protein
MKDHTLLLILVVIVLAAILFIGVGGPSLGLDTYIDSGHGLYSSRADATTYNANAEGVGNA